MYQMGIKRTSAHLILRALSPPNRSNNEYASLEQHLRPTRIGISVSQKVSKRAVVRNRIKRQIRAALRQFLSHLSPGWQLVIVVKPNATQCDYEEFLQELEQLLTNAEVLNGY